MIDKPTQYYHPAGATCASPFKLKFGFPYGCYRSTVNVDHRIYKDKTVDYAAEKTTN